MVRGCWRAMNGMGWERKLHARWTATHLIKHAAKAGSIREDRGELRCLRQATHAVASRVRSRVASKGLGAHIRGLAVLLAACAEDWRGASVEVGFEARRSRQPAVDTVPDDAKHAARLDNGRGEAAHSWRAAHIITHVAQIIQASELPAISDPATALVHAQWDRDEGARRMVLPRGRGRSASTEDTVQSILGGAEGLDFAFDLRQDVR